MVVLLFALAFAFAIVVAFADVVAGAFADATAVALLALRHNIADLTHRVLTFVDVVADLEGDMA